MSTDFINYTNWAQLPAADEKSLLYCTKRQILSTDDADFADFFSNLRTLRHLQMISEGRQAVTIWR